MHLPFPSKWTPVMTELIARHKEHRNYASTEWMKLLSRLKHHEKIDLRSDDGQADFSGPLLPLDVPQTIVLADDTEKTKKEREVTHIYVVDAHDQDWVWNLSKRRIQVAHKTTLLKQERREKLAIPLEQSTDDPDLSSKVRFNRTEKGTWYRLLQEPGH